MQLRRAPLAALAVSSALALAGCGSSTPGGAERPAGPATSAATSPAPSAPSAPSASILTRAQAANAVISLADLGSGFKVDHDNGGGASDLGCLDDIDKLLKQEGVDDDPGASDSEHDAQYKAATGIGMPFVLSTVDSERSTSQIHLGFALIEKALRTCRHVDTTDDSGAHLQLAITTDRTVSKGADDQLNLSANGQMSLPGPNGQTLTVPFYLRVDFAQVGNNLAMVGYGSMVARSEGDQDAEGLTEFAIARLKAVASGTPVPTAPDFGLRKITIADLLDGLSGGSTGSV
ncbi:MAG TPA: hypothetical protein VN088_21415 [Nocardioides sp.]|nr:hypothetical protein [Nocardioides sp.]